MTPQDLSTRIERAKREILDDILKGTVPVTVTTFAALHDYVDANGYGGAFEPDAPDSDDDIWNALQSALDLWLRDGGIFTEILASYGAEREEYTDLVRRSDLPVLLAQLEEL
jgi:hypothetical protein